MVAETNNNSAIQEFLLEALDKLNPQPIETPKKGIKFLPYVRVLQRKAFFIISITSLFAITAYLVSMRDPDTYVGGFQLLVEPVDSTGKTTDISAIARSLSAGDNQIVGLDYSTQIQILTSPRMIDSIAEEIKKKLPQANLLSIKANLMENLKVERVGNTRATETKILQVTYRGEDPRLVQLVLDVTSNKYLSYSLNEKQSNIKNGVEFIEKQIPNLRQRVDVLLTKKKEIQQKYKLVDPTIKAQEIFTQIDGINALLLETERQLIEQKTGYLNLQKQLNLNSEQALVSSDLSQNPERLALIEQLQEIDNQLAIESGRFTDNHPTIQTLKQARNNLITLFNQKTDQIIREDRVQISSNPSVQTFQDGTRLALIQQLLEINKQISMLEARLRSLQQTKAGYQQQSQQFPALIRQYNDLEQQLKLSNQILDQLLLQKETLKVEFAQKEIPWQLLSKPQLPTNNLGVPEPFPPDPKKKVAAGFIVGFLLSIGLSFLWEKRQDLFYSTADIEDALSVDLLAEIPFDENLKKLDNLTESPGNQEIIETENIEGDSLQLKERINLENLSFIQAFDTLYIKLSFLFNNPPIRSVVISSVESGDGQTTVAINLAKIAAQAGQKVILIDTNLNKPQIHSVLNVSNFKGLSNILAQQLPLEYVIQKVPDYDNLFVLPTGVVQQSSAPRIWSKSMESLLKQLENEYDLVIIDGPHFLDSHDINFLSTHSDGIVMVVGVNKTSQALVYKAAQTIHNYNLLVLGCVANHLS